MENLRGLLTELESRKVSGFTVSGATTVEELRNLVSSFAREIGLEIPEDGFEGRKLTAIRFVRAGLKEKRDKGGGAGGLGWLSGMGAAGSAGASAPGASAGSEASAVPAPQSQPSDPYQQALALYTGAVLFMTRHLEMLKEGRPSAWSKALRLVQDLTEFASTHSFLLLGLTQNGRGEEVLAHHLVNSAVLTVAFGSEIGIPKGLLKDLGLCALFNEAGMHRLPAEHRLWLQTKQLPPESQQILRSVVFAAAGEALSEQSIGRLQLLRAVSSVQMHQPFGAPEVDAQGRLIRVVQKGDPFYFSRLLAIVSRFDTLTCPAGDHPPFDRGSALDVLWNKERFRFDPELVAAFVAWMAGKPYKTSCAA